jgi:hypothetical protein
MHDTFLTRPLAYAVAVGQQEASCRLLMLVRQAVAEAQGAERAALEALLVRVEQAERASNMNQEVARLRLWRCASAALAEQPEAVTAIGQAFLLLADTTTGGIAHEAARAADWMDGEM